MTPLRRIALMTQWTEFDSGAERVALELAQRVKLPLTVVVPLLSNPEFEVVAHDLVAEEEAATATRRGQLQRARTRRGRDGRDSRAPRRRTVARGRRRGARGTGRPDRDASSWSSRLSRQAAGRRDGAADCSACPVSGHDGPARGRDAEAGILVVVESGDRGRARKTERCRARSLLGNCARRARVVPPGTSRHRGEALLQRAADVARQAHLSIDGAYRDGSS